MINWTDPKIMGAIILSVVTILGLVIAKVIEYKVSNRKESIDALIAKTYAKFKQLLFLNYLNEMQYFPTKRRRNRKDLDTIELVKELIIAKDSADNTDAFFTSIKNQPNRVILINLFGLNSIDKKDKDELAKALFELDLDQFGDVVPLPHFPRYTLNKIREMTDKEIYATFVDLTTLAVAYNDKLSVFKKKVNTCLADTSRQECFYDYPDNNYPTKKSLQDIFNLSWAKTRDLVGLPKSLNGKTLQQADYSRKMLYKHMSNPDVLASLSDKQHDPAKLKEYLEGVKTTASWGDEVSSLRLKTLQVKSNLSGRGFEDMIFSSANNVEIRRKGFNGVAIDLFSTEEFDGFIQKESFYKSLPWSERAIIRSRKIANRIRNIF